MKNVEVYTMKYISKKIMILPSLSEIQLESKLKD
jgi:hypothetical protein